MSNAEFQLEEEQRCPRCDGDGLQYTNSNGTATVTCHVCNGTGYIVSVTEFGQQILDFIDKYRPNGGVA